MAATYADAYEDLSTWPDHGFEHFELAVGSSAVASSSTPLFIHGIHSPNPSSSAAAVLLLHGFPQNLNIWHRLAPLLKRKYHVVAMDLRGYGKSARPEGQACYTKREMANDAVQVMEKLGHRDFYVVGHDRGARVAHRLALDHPRSVRKAVFLDINPTLWMYDHVSLEFATKYWHWFALIVPSPAAELLFAVPDPGELVRLWMLKSFPDVDPAALASYVAMSRIPNAMQRMIEDYRASAPGAQDLTLDKEDMQSGRRIECEVKVIWGQKGIIGSAWDPVEAWTQACARKELLVGAVEAKGIGHYIPEEAEPAWLLDQVDSFFCA